MALIEQVNSPKDLKRFSILQLKQLAEEIRNLIIETVARNGGHLAPNLGVVELTLALHYVFSTPNDVIVWDVGHQCYTHKIITGRRDRFFSLRQYGGISGFPKRTESEYDVFDTGHSGNSISVALGLATGYQFLNKNRRVLAVIGDGSIVTGMALEAINHAGTLKRDITVVLNDNEMSIARSTGAIAVHLNRIITGKMYNRIREDTWLLLGYLPKDLSKRARQAAHKLEEGLKNLIVPSILFEEFGFRYIGPVDGHNIGELIETFRRVENFKGPIVVHVVTQKGRGYVPAVRHPERFHGTGPFNPVTGETLTKSGSTFTDAFGRKLVELAAKDERIVAITAGMCLGTGLAEFRERFPERFFDVGIAEQHAVTFAAGLAQAGLKPVVAIYSTFLLRALDQLVQDICLQGLPVILAVDRAGLVGEDGSTHHGVYDLSYLTMIPGMVIAAPRDEYDLMRILEFAIKDISGPFAIRYPRGGSNYEKEEIYPSERRTPIEMGKGEILQSGNDGAVLAVGTMVENAMRAAQIVAQKGLYLAVADARFVKPIDEELIRKLSDINGKLITLEENTLLGGFGNNVSLVIEKRKILCRLRRIGLPDKFIGHGPRKKLLDDAGLSAEALANVFYEFFG